MTANGWQQLSMTDIDALMIAIRQTHAASRWLERTAGAYIEARDDFSHFNLGWLQDQNAFITHALPDGSNIGLRMSDLTLLVMRDDQLVSELGLGDLNDIEIGAWLRKEIVAAGLDPARLDAAMQKDASGEHWITSGGYQSADIPDALGEAAKWYSNADLLLKQVAGRHKTLIPGPSPVRCWPHHFDIATLISLNTEVARTIGVGLSPGDDSYSEPYFYVSLWPYPEKSELSGLPPLGHWHTQGFTAAIVTARAILGSGEQYADTAAFLDKAVTISLNILQEG